MDFADLIAMAIIGMSVLAPALAKLKKRAAAPPGGTGAVKPTRTISGAEPQTGLKIQPTQQTTATRDARTSAGQGATTRQGKIIRSKPRPPREAPGRRSTKEGGSDATLAGGEQIALPPAAPLELQGRSRGPTGSPRLRWTRLQEAVVYREMLGPPKALQQDD